MVLDLHPTLSEADISCIVAMAWQDDTPFEAIALQFAVNEHEVIALMRAKLKTRSFRAWRMRVRGRSAKHQVMQKALQPARPQGERQAQKALAAALGTSLLNSPEDFPLPLSAVTRQSLR